MNRIVATFISVLVLMGCGEKGGSLFSNPSSDETGIAFANTLTPNQDVNILDYLYFYNGGGVAVGDINGDELPDIFFSGNQVKNRLYINKGNLNFEDITEKAGVAGNSSWNTGAVMGDVNGDGLLDIYVCAVVGINGLGGFNELYINNGPSTAGGAVTFTESASQYGLDFDSFSSSAAFLDYDLDGDLDIYLLNHAVHTQESYGNVDTRKKRNYQTGDKLLRNDNGTFTDVSEEAGIYGGVNGYGLGVAIADFNRDGYPDIFVGNDFHEDDYYYLNNGDGTFTESLRQYFGHTSKFSMGNDVTDINHDGWPDILSLDMLPDNEKILKSSEGDNDFQTQRLRTKEFGYHYQYSRNMLFVNQPKAPYAEVALLSGVAATDWSWSAVFADFDQDSEQDVFISNGIAKRPNDLDYINFVSSEQIKNKINSTKLVDNKALAMMPSGAIPNRVLRGTENLVFQDVSKEWIASDTLISGATAMADLDLDGDIDLVTNNSDQEATLYINKTNNRSNYLKLRFKYAPQNHFGIGTQVYSYHKGKLQFKELYTARGFQASSEPLLHFGYGTENTIDSLRIIWPDRSYQLLKNVTTNQTLTLSPENTRPFDYRTLQPKTWPIFEKVPGNLGIEFTHKEDRYTDFNRQKLIPYQIGDRGPATALGDLNSDGKTDVFFGGSKHIPSEIYIQTDTAFQKFHNPEIKNDSIKEDVAAVSADFNSDGKDDLFVASGGGDFFGQAAPLSDSYYIQKEGGFTPEELPQYFENASVIKPFDFDADGDLDVFIGNEAITNDFGASPASYLLENENGKFKIHANTSFEKVGMLTDALWSDFDADGITDLILVGEWMAPKFFKNENGRFKEVDAVSQKTNGLWQCIAPFDMDGDGDLDYVLGNWGANSKFKASHSAPMRMYYADFDGNASTETIVTIAKNGTYYPLEDLGGLAAQLVSLRKKFTTYKDFAGKSIEEVIDPEALQKATILEVHELRSGYLENDQGTFTFIPFQNDLQVAPITSFLPYDFDGDNQSELLAAGNYFGVKPFHGRFGSFTGAMIKDKNNVVLGYEIGLDFANKSVRNLNIITFQNHPYLLATFNNEKAQVYKLNTKNIE